MKIVFLVSSLGSGGAERVAATLCNAWCARGNNVILVPTFSGKGECFFELSSDIRIVYLADLVAGRKRSIINQLSRLKMLRKLIKAERPDAIVSFLSNVNVAAIIATTGIDIPLVVCERTDPFVFPTPFSLRWARKLTYRFANALVVQTKNVASKFVADKWNIQILRVIGNAIPESVLGVRHKDSTDRIVHHLLAIGRMDEGKQFDRLIKVFADIASDNESWNLRIVGDGPLREKLMQQVIDLGLDKRVEMPGRIENVGAEFSCADIFVLTSKFEGFPNVLLEAMAAGLPCVTYDCQSGPREMSLDGQVAMLVALNDERALGQALARLMSDRELRHTLGNQAMRSVIERYSADRVMRQWDALFEDVGVRH